MSNRRSMNSLSFCCCRRCSIILVTMLLQALASYSVFASVIAKTNHGRHHHDTQAQAALNEVKALTAFKKGISIDPFDTLANWNEETPTACNYTGITCSSSNSKHPGRVVEIVLENTLMVGSISPSIANISFLRRLELGNNSFSGQIPCSLGKLHRLNVLNLCLNHLDGPIPATLGNLSSLLVLHLCSNSFTGNIPLSISGLRSLQQFNVYMNLLTGQIAPFIGTFYNLNLLDLGNNKFHGSIPGEFGNLSLLRFLDLQQNALKGLIPCSLAKLAHLTKLYISQNSLSGNIPLCLTNLTSLADLDLSFNRLHGTLSVSLGIFQKLEFLILGGNSFEGSIPESLSNISSLKALALQYNRLQGPLPIWIGSFNSLQAVLLHFNFLSGSIPDTWANATELQIISLSNNSLTGSIPSSLGKLSKLSIFHVGYNYITSGISKPSQIIPLFKSLSNMSELSNFEMPGNLIAGTLPLVIGNFWPKLSKLLLSENFISGQVPPSIGNFSSLHFLRLDNNKLDGSIPYLLASMQSIQYLDLSSNKLHGKIPTEISSLNKTLVYFYLYDNRFSGSIPPSIGNLANLRRLSLQRNLLTGNIPAELGECHLLESLVLSENLLKGTIPSEVADLKNIIFEFDLSQNLLKGPVPAEVQGLQMAQFINLASNQLSGTIGLYMKNWLDVREVNLSFNNFSGSIPSSIGNQMRQVQSIDLSQNSFMGSVPETFFNLSSLHYLNLSFNNFSGEISCSKSVSRKVRFSNFSFTPNPNLCGKCLGLQPCQSPAAHHNSHSESTTGILKSVLIAITSTAVFGLICMGTLFYVRRTKSFKPPEPNRLDDLFLKLSVEELHRATDNFSSANLVGEGSHGKVYRGVLSSAETVAIKCFTCTNENDYDKNFRKECHILGQVRHRNIVKIITVVWSDNLKAIVMPYMKNGNLDSLLHFRHTGKLLPLNLVTRLRILREMASGLSYLHHYCHQQVIHCDIKPENVLLDSDWTVKLSDFGIARFIQNLKASATTPSGVKGSVGYIAPEYGTGDAVSQKGDVYSFGIVTLELITRLKPTHEMFWGDLTLRKFVSMAFEGDTPQEKRQKLQEILKSADAEGGGIDTEDDEEMKTVKSILLMGLQCTLEDPRTRPTMKEVESILSSVCAGDVSDPRTNPESLEQVLELVQLQPPLLGNTTNRESISTS